MLEGFSTVCSSNTQSRHRRRLLSQTRADCFPRVTAESLKINKKMGRIGGFSGKRSGFSVMSWVAASLNLRWRGRRSAGSSPPHSCWPRDNGGPSYGCSAYRYCRRRTATTFVLFCFLSLPDWLKFCKFQPKYTQLFFFKIYNVKSNFFFFYNMSELTELSYFREQEPEFQGQTEPRWPDFMEKIFSFISIVPYHNKAGLDPAPSANFSLI